MKDEDTQTHKVTQDRVALLQNALDATQNGPAERAISAMEVVVWYVAMLGRVEHFKRGEEHVFRVTREFIDSEGRKGEGWEEKLLNPYALRDEFLRIKEWSGALEFLGSSGTFSPFDDTLTWSEFKKWQRFVYLIQEHKQLAAAMQSGNWGEECGEVLKAITGIYPSSFFDHPQQPESRLEAKWKADPHIWPMIQKGVARHEEVRRKLWEWFREPPASACSIQWVPKQNADMQAISRKLQAGGAMIEFLLPQNALKPVLLLRPSNTIQAIAAAIYADRINGVEYRACDVCKSLFKLGVHKDKKYCDREGCKNRAHQRNRRAAARTRESESTKTRKTKKGRQK